MKSRLACGLMSGTSLDGVDAALIRLSGTGVRTRFTMVAFVHHPFPRGLQDVLLRIAGGEETTVSDIARLNVLLAELYADAVRSVAKRAKVRLADIDFIGSHGQTICHLPRPKRMMGKTIRATLQIGDGSVLATLTGITTVSDFRAADIAVGGEGAPLVPYFDWLVFQSVSRSRVMLNIGGIANITILPACCRPDQVIAFDTGPGNMLVDALTRRFYGKSYDRGGRIASTGRVEPNLLRWMMNHRYVKAAPPKSTGREMFGEDYVSSLIQRAKGIRKRNILATASIFTPMCVFDSCRRFAGQVDDLIVSGGGIHNRLFMRGLGMFFGSQTVKTTDDYGVPSNAKEAICFAVLANETLAGNPANLPSVTGASRRVVLGKISSGRKRGL